MVSAAFTVGNHIRGMLDPHANHPHGREHRLGCLPHGELPRVSLAEIAAHADEREEGKARPFDQESMLDAVADATRLHQQHRARAAEIRAGDERNALLLRGQRNGVDVRVGKRPVDENAVTGIGNVGNLRDAVSTQQIIKIMLPNCCRRRFDHCIHL